MIYTPHHIKGNALALWYKIICTYCVCSNRNTHIATIYQHVIANKTPTVEEGRIVTSPGKVPWMVEGTEIVTGKRNKKRERQELAEEGRCRQQTTLADLQQFVEIDYNTEVVEVSPKFDPVQESSAYPPKMPPSARRLLPPSDGDSNPPPVRGSSAG